MSKIEKPGRMCFHDDEELDIIDELIDGHNDHDTRLEALTQAHTGRLINVETRIKALDEQLYDVRGDIGLINEVNAEEQLKAAWKRIKNLEDDSYCYANHLKVLEQKLKELTHPPNDIKPEHQHRTENLIADPEDLTTESWPVDDGVRPLPTEGHWECSECGKDWGHGVALTRTGVADTSKIYHCPQPGGCNRYSVKWIEPKADLSDYSEEAQESILRGLKQKGDIDLGSFAEYANTENKADTVTAEPEGMELPVESCAYRITMSQHEWTWTQEEQEAMARYIVFLESDEAKEQADTVRGMMLKASVKAQKKQSEELIQARAENAELNAERITKNDVVLKYRNDIHRLTAERAKLNEEMTSMLKDTVAANQKTGETNGVAIAGILELKADNAKLKEQIGCIQAICDNAHEYKVNDFITAIRHALPPKEKV